MPAGGTFSGVVLIDRLLVVDRLCIMPDATHIGTNWASATLERTDPIFHRSRADAVYSTQGCGAFAPRISRHAGAGGAVGARTAFLHGHERGRRTARGPLQHADPGRRCDWHERMVAGDRDRDWRDAGTAALGGAARRRRRARQDRPA